MAICYYLLYQVASTCHPKIVNFYHCVNMFRRTEAYGNGVTGLSSKTDMMHLFMKVGHCAMLVWPIHV